MICVILLVVAHALDLANSPAGVPDPLAEHDSPCADFETVVLGARHGVPMDPTWDGESMYRLNVVMEG